jgi:hypothetical protein
LAVSTGCVDIATKTGCLQLYRLRRQIRPAFIGQENIIPENRSFMPISRHKAVNVLAPSYSNLSHSHGQSNKPSNLSLNLTKNRQHIKIQTKSSNLIPIHDISVINNKKFQVGVQEYFVDKFPASC